MTVDRKKLLAIHEELGNKAREIMTAKNHDYAHEGDVFRNFRRYGTFGVLVRLSDKLARLDSFEENKTFAVADEKLIDTVIDLINYAVIYYAMKQETSVEDWSGGHPDHVKEGPYCGVCNHNLADFRWEAEGWATMYYCSNCCAEHNIPTGEMTLMGTL